MNDEVSIDSVAGPSAEITSAAERIQALRAEIGKVVVGQEQVITECIIGLLAGGHVLLEGVPGLGKTLLVRALSEAVGGEFSRVQFTPDLMPSDVTGHAMYDEQQREFVIRRGPAFCNFLLADEINRAPAKTQSSLLEVMQEGQVTIEGESFTLEQPYMVLATQNPLEQEGTYPLPEAQLDRFLIQVMIDYPSLQEEIDMVEQISRASTASSFSITNIDTVLTPADIIALQTLTSSITVDQRVLEYAVNIVRATRESAGIEIGAGPRASLALVRVARAQALIKGRDFVLPSDIKSVAPAVLRHRLGLSPELQMEGQATDQVIARLLEHIEAPRL